MMGVCNLVPPITQTPAETFAALQSYFFVLFSQIILKLGYCAFLESFLSGPGRFSQTGPSQNFENRVERVYYRARKQFESKKGEL